MGLKVSWVYQVYCSSGLFLSKGLCGPPLSFAGPSPSSAAGRVRNRTANNSALTINMHIAPPFIAAAYKKRRRYHHRADVTSAHVTSVHVTHTSRQGRQ